MGKAGIQYIWRKGYSERHQRTNYRWKNAKGRTQYRKNRRRRLILSDFF